LEEEGKAVMHVLKPHVSLDVSNIDASVAFYERVFGKTASACCAPSAMPEQDKPCSS
jgi:predicted enzyme related to lactoylglutathione lyase